MEGGSESSHSNSNNLQPRLCSSQTFLLGSR